MNDTINCILSNSLIVRIVSFYAFTPLFIDEREPESYEAVNRVVGLFFAIYDLNMKGPNKHIKTSTSNLSSLGGTT